MKHLFNISVYHFPEDLRRACSAVGSEGSCVDGLELLTGYGKVDPSLQRFSTSVHLPHSIDWYGPATGIRPVTSEITGDDLKFRHYGIDRNDIVRTLRLALRCAEPMEPMYGVLHASSANILEILASSYTDSDEKVLSTLISILNEVVSDFPEKEPPFTIALENTWWPGMRLLDGSLHDMLESELKFDDWGICLDTGHILFSSKLSTDEATALKVLNGCADNYPDELFDRLIAMHLHVNTSANLIDSTAVDDGHLLPVDERVTKAFGRICSIDQHRPFTDPVVREYVERLAPEFVVHEMSSPSIPEQIRDHICQASFFK